MKARLTHHLLAALLGLLFTAGLASQASPITYQGSLQDNGLPANGQYDLHFRLWNSEIGGLSDVGNQSVENVTVTEGLFTVTLDLSSKLLKDGPLWLEIYVRPNGSTDDYTMLSPRQQLTSAAYAVMAEAVSGPIQADQLAGTIAPANIAAGSVTGPMLAENSVTSTQLAVGSVRADNLAAGSVTGEKLATRPAITSSKLVPNPFPAEGKQIGRAIAFVGTDYILIGDEEDDTGEVEAGAAYLLDRQGNLITRFLNPTPEYRDNFGAAVAAVGTDRVVIRARRDDYAGVYAGAAYLFDLQGNLIVRLDNPFPSQNDGFGVALASIGGSHVMVANLTIVVDGIRPGATYLFDLSGNLIRTFQDPTPADREGFGAAIAGLGADRVIIGVPSEGSDGFNVGIAYLFDLEGNIVTTFHNPTPANGDKFGEAVAAVGTNRVVIGAQGNIDNGVRVGAAYLFDLEGNLITTFENPTPVSADRSATRFGSALAAVGMDRVLIGDYSEEVPDLINGRGAAFLFDLTGNLLTRLDNPHDLPIALGDSFGEALASDGDHGILIGNHRGNTQGVDSGSVHLYNLGEAVEGIVAQGVASGSIVGSSLADGVVTSSKLDPSIGVWTQSGDNIHWSGGNVGIGTSDPQDALHVAGGFLRVDGWGNEQVYLGGDGWGDDVQLGSLRDGVNRVSLYNPASGMMSLEAENVTAFNTVTAGSFQGPVEASQITGTISSTQLAPGAAAENLAAGGQAGVATGGLILSESENPALESAGYVKVGTIQTGDTWLRGASSGVARSAHTAVWTGSEMIVWGGATNGFLANDGGRYNPTTDTWAPVNQNGAPSARQFHTAVWTGSEMIVWGGITNGTSYKTAQSDGARYDPVTDSWSPVSGSDAPWARSRHTAVWTGSEMIVWGGYNAGSQPLSSPTGARYNPTTDQWTTMSNNGALGAAIHTAIWTGSEMIVWGGYDTTAAAALGSGGRYNPVLNTWAHIPATYLEARTSHTAIWTGTEMIIWGGWNGNTGHPVYSGTYDPSSGTWKGLYSSGEPIRRYQHTAVWTGAKMIAWGGVNDAEGHLNSGGDYDPDIEGWGTTSVVSAPPARVDHTAVWIGSKMIVYGSFHDRHPWSYTPPKVMYLYLKQ